MHLQLLYVDLFQYITWRKRCSVVVIFFDQLLKSISLIDFMSKSAYWRTAYLNIRYNAKNCKLMTSHPSNQYHKDKPSSSIILIDMHSQCLDSVDPFWKELCTPRFPNRKHRLKGRQIKCSSNWNVCWTYKLLQFHTWLCLISSWETNTSPIAKPLAT